MQMFDVDIYKLNCERIHLRDHQKQYDRLLPTCQGEDTRIYWIGYIQVVEGS